MPIRTHPVRATGVAFTVAAALSGLAWGAAIPDAVKNLSGSADDAARSVMASNGFVQRSDKSSWGRHQTYWWNDKARQCVLLTSVGGRILKVEGKGESDCKAGPITTAAGTAFDPAPLVGLPRRAADERLAAAGFNAINTDMSKGEMIYIWWSNGRQCLAGNIAGDRYELLQTMPPKDCGIK